jgi:hypothetical protein
MRVCGTSSGNSSSSFLTTSPHASCPSERCSAFTAFSADCCAAKHAHSWISSPFEISAWRRSRSACLSQSFERSAMPKRVARPARRGAPAPLPAAGRIPSLRREDVREEPAFSKTANAVEKYSRAAGEFEPGRSRFGDRGRRARRPCTLHRPARRRMAVAGCRDASPTERRE